MSDFRRRRNTGNLRRASIFVRAKVVGRNGGFVGDSGVYEGLDGGAISFFLFPFSVNKMCDAH